MQRGISVMRMIRGVLVGGVLMACAASASAHRIAAPMTVISPNARTGLWEVVHRISVHDMEPLLLAAGVGTAGEEGEAALLAFAGDYVADRFDVEGTRAPVRLDFVGAEVDGDFVFVYFEFDSDDQPVVLRNAIMVDDAESFGFAFVNVEDGQGAVVTGMFTAQERAARAELCFQVCR